MRVQDSFVELTGDDYLVEVTEYHDQSGDVVGPRHWHARVVLQDDGPSPKVLNYNRATQQELFAALSHLRTIIESAQAAVLDSAAV